MEEGKPGGTCENTTNHFGEIIEKKLNYWHKKATVSGLNLQQKGKTKIGRTGGGKKGGTKSGKYHSRSAGWSARGR